MLVERIAASARQQAASFAEGNTAIEQMDSLASAPDLLADLVNHFSLDRNGPAIRVSRRLNERFYRADRGQRKSPDQRGFSEASLN
jgi:hypothetical protein